MPTTTITMHAVTPMLKANSIDETITFYSEILGFHVANRMEHWCALCCGDAEVMFYDHDGLQPEPPQMTGVLYFNPADVKALWDQIREKAKVEWSLQTMPYNMVEFAIRDCNGYILSFGQDVKSVAPPLPPRHEE